MLYTFSHAYCAFVFLAALVLLVFFPSFFFNLDFLFGFF